MREFIKKNIDMKKSEISFKTYLWALFMFFLFAFGTIQYVLKPVIYMTYNEYDVSYPILTIFFTLLLFLLISILNKFRFFVLNTQNQTLYYYSLFRPFGKTLYFKDYIGVYQTTETGTSGSYKVLYLVDKKNITRFKIMGLYYKNMDEIIEAIPLPQIKRNLSGKEYFKLMFTGKANLSKIKDKKSTENKTIGYLKIFIAIAFLIFILGMIIRVISRIN